MIINPSSNTVLKPIRVRPYEAPKFSYPQVEVIIYCNEGPVIKFDGNSSDLLSVSTSKSLRSPVGTFELRLAPSGPLSTADSQSTTTSVLNLPQAYPDYTSVISQNSLVIIRMKRIDRESSTYDPQDVFQPATVMVGVVTHTDSLLSYEDKDVKHIITVSGTDFSYYLTRESYYTFSSLPILQSQALAITSTANLTPKAAGEQWLNDVIFGEHGFLSLVNFYPAPKGKVEPIPLSDLFYYSFLDYTPAQGASIPVQFTLFQSDGAWWTKFQNIFIPPLYEFFVNTAPLNFYPQAAQVSGGSNTFPPSLLSSKYQEGVPVLVARTNPNPFVYYNFETNEWILANFLVGPTQGINYYLLSKDNIISAQVGYWQSDIKNFFLFQPYLFSYNNGFSNALTKSLPLLFGTIIDQRSFLKYGYAPAQVTSFWFSDTSGNAAKTLSSETLSFSQTYLSAVSQVASYYSTIPNLLAGRITIPLAPNLLIGNFLETNPWKEGVFNSTEQSYVFYVTGVEHRWVMGGPSQTHVTLERGIPHSIFTDQAKLKDFLLNNYTRVNGTLQPIPPEERSESGLTYIPSADFQKMFSDLGVNIGSIIDGFSKPITP